jgi:hypothetical protein
MNTSFFAGMAIGMFVGCALGILIMCLLAAGKCNECVVELSRQWKQLKQLHKEGTVDG